MKNLLTKILTVACVIGIALALSAAVPLFDAVHPAGVSPWGMRLQLVLLFPKLTREQQKMLLEKKLKQMEQEDQQKQ